MGDFAVSDLDLRVAKVLNTFDKLVKKNQLAVQMVILFKTKQIPLLSKIALWVIHKQKGRLDLKFINLKK